MSSLKTSFSICHGARLSLSFHKIGCGSAMSSLKTSFPICHGARLSLSLHSENNINIKFTYEEKNHYHDDDYCCSMGMYG